MLFAQLYLQLAGQKDDGEGDRRYPEQGKTHPPVINQQRDADNRRGKDGAPELGNCVRKGVLEARAVAHDGVLVRSERSRLWKKRRGSVRSFSASVMRRRSLS